LSKQVKLTALPRAAAGKGETNRLRREGRVPAILYGYKVVPTAVSLNERELFHALHGPAGRNATIALDVEGVTTLVVARDIQRHALRRDVLHIDLLAVDRDVKIDVEVPVHLTGVDDVARDGGFLNQVRYVVPINVRPLDTPDFIELSVAGMGIGDVKRLGDLVALLPDGAEIADDPDRVIVTINAPAGAEASDTTESAGDTAEGEAAAAGSAPADGDAAA
jgi:large subunit ribosomal protein L25